MTAHVDFTFQQETLDGCYEEARPLLELHWQEIAQHKELMTINPAIELYRKADRAGRLLIITARLSGKLVGYIVFLLNPHPHYKHVLTAQEDIHFLHPDCRRGLNGYNFLKTACKLAFQDGVQLVVMREKIGHDHLSVMTRIGFQPTDIVYTMTRDMLRS